MKRTLALFDFDGTMIRGDSIAAFVRSLFFKGLVPLPRMADILWKTLKWKLGLIPAEEVKTLALSPLRALDSAAVEKACRGFALEALWPRVYPAALSKMAAHAERGDLVLVVSASPEVYLKYLMEKLPVDGILATRVNKQFEVTFNAVRENKTAMIRDWLKEQDVQADFDASSAYGDSANDLPMLRMVGHPHLVNPRKKARRLGAGMAVLHWGRQAGKPAKAQ